MRIDTLLSHIESGQRTFSAGRVTRYVRRVLSGDQRMIGYSTRLNGKTKYVRLTDFASWAAKPGAVKRKVVKK